MVVDASAIIELLLATAVGRTVAQRIQRQGLHAPAHIDAEALSALGRLQRNGQLSERDVSSRLKLLTEAPIERHPLSPLLLGAWRRRKNLRLVDALYVELASQLDLPLLTTDTRLASATRVAELVRES
ncbi:MAG: type II toxin-antitoxin system VapC family toxin [Chloroflexi bacterium]|nr:MAG: type II toxin-antitoxin system VapC family toxin [Chloroflexota bacterium]TME46947.1 MAG: type II toxin-antitoxin system VapC family toxin [Chloroflexota bacterium]